MEAERSSQKAFLPFRPLIKKALCRFSNKRKDAAPEAAPPEEVAQGGIDEVPATQFPRFPELPTELRLKIWTEATKYKRYVLLTPPCNSAASSISLVFRMCIHQQMGYKGERRPAWTSTTPPPTLLSVSSEAREVGLRCWKRAFAFRTCPASVVSTTTFQYFCLLACLGGLEPTNMGYQTLVFPMLTENKDD